MNCEHTNKFCRHAVVCIMKTDDQKAEACMSFCTETRPNQQTVRTCAVCRRNPCAFMCFRQASDRRLGL